MRSVGGAGGALPDFFCLFSFPVSADYERDWPPCKVVFRVGNQYAEECEKQTRLLSGEQRCFGCSGLS